MNIRLNHKVIQEMCGMVSFKRGDYFYRSDKVTFEHYQPNRCQATVIGEEKFHVTVETDTHGNILTECSCPKLASFAKDCQHIAAVLIAIYDHQRQGTIPSTATNQGLAEGLRTLFTDPPVRSSGHQLHFEKRKVLDVEFTCKPIAIGNGRYIFGIEMKLGSTTVENIRGFLEQVRVGKRCFLSASFTYDPSLHCFQNETDAVIQQLIQVIRDESVYGNTESELENHQTLHIPPTTWEQLLPLLVKASQVKMEYNGRTFAGMHVTDESLPLQFDFIETEGEGYQLKVNSFHRMIVLEAYRTVLFEGKIKQLETQDCKRLSDLKQMLAASGTDQIPIPHAQLHFFLEKVAQGLKKLGKVTVAESLTSQWMKTPLSANLYLDRVKNRLLAGLEFHYGNIVLNPLENRELPAGTMMVRDVDKEEEILKLIEDSSFAKTDGGYYLHNEELEYEFLYYIVPKLQKLVQIYATTAVRNRIFRENARPQIRVKVKKERTNWLEFKFEMDGIPEKQIREILEALEEKRKYYRLPNGSLLSLQTRELEEIQRFLQSPHVENKDIAGGLDLPVEKSLQLLDSVDVSDAFKLEESFRQLLDHLYHPGRLEFEIPASLDPILKSYQKLGYQWMKTLTYYGFGGILADDMGLGKTIQSIAFVVSELPNIRKNKQPVLVVCPSSVTYNWLNEIKKFAGPEIQAVVIDGNKAERSKLLKEVTDIDVLITSYPLLRREITWFEKQSFHTVFFDEAQAFKNPLTQTARAAKKLQSVHRFALTGTPVENSSEELWSIFHVVFPELFRGLKEFSQLSRKKISRRIRPFLLRRLKEDVLAELPEKIESQESVELFPEQKKLYAAYLAKLRHDTLKHLDKDTIRKNRIKILAGLTRQRQICCHPSLFVDGYKGSSSKFEQLLQIVEESKQSGRRVLIFSQFTKMLELIGRAITAKGLPFFYLDGTTPAEERVKICERFNQGERDFFLISLKAGGTGLNLMSADTVILYDTWWNPAVEEQAADRAHRMGQKNVVQVIKLVARGTIEEKMNELQDKKRHLIEEIIDSEEKINSILTEEDIREILMI
ncbi:DEAD/DEAH box helicase [Neobacillus vireti]|uniref:Non-specific serine/threonine protein kinase n=1 Tax=Neobacillus vireti LMG 21834 TaxID=1131730 RepID=A0AB94IGC4_9BACI|nr:DEAD/DEAH box helicase [Neobacillus vireti]ETI66162.1 non-specific serine/threonine protein kinase [Neobacillus vireti LMG 21834]KLT17746.1 helicase SNF [Neobacillus vireti]